MRDNIFYIKHRSGHHASHSGYSLLIDNIKSDYCLKRSDPYFLPYLFRKFISNRIRRLGAPIYDSESFRKELILSLKMFRERKGIAHFLDGERDVFFSPLFKKYKDWRTVATFHYPPDILAKKITNYKHLQRLDAAIAVGTNQISFLKEKLLIDRVAFIPHGVDTNFFMPSNNFSQNDVENCTALFVGYHLRDIETLINATEIVRKRFPKFKLRIIMSESYKKIFPNTSTYQFYPNISDDELRRLYQTSQIMLMPLLDSTANNSLLEGMACGLPSIVTDVGSVKDYVNENTSILVRPKDAKAMADSVVFLMESQMIVQQMRKSSREESLKFDWTNISRQMVQKYKLWFD